MISRIVKVYDKATNELINEFDSIEAVAYEYDLGRETVRKSIKGINIRGDVYFRCEGESPFTNRKTKVYWYDKNTNQLLGVFDSALQASQKTGIPVATIRNNLCGRAKTVWKKYRFESPQVEFKPKNPEPYIQKGQPKKWLYKPIDVYDATTNEVLKECESLTEAANFIGCTTARVATHLAYIPTRKKQPTIYKKYYCKYHNE